MSMSTSLLSMSEISSQTLNNKNTSSSEQATPKKSRISMRVIKLQTGLSKNNQNSCTVGQDMSKMPSASDLLASHLAKFRLGRPKEKQKTDNPTQATYAKGRPSARYLAEAMAAATESASERSVGQLASVPPAAAAVWSSLVTSHI